MAEAKAHNPRCRRVMQGMLLALTLGGSSVRGADEAGALLRDTTFEELANLTVTTVSRHEQKLFDVPAALSVLTCDEVRESGAFSLAEALREIPGLNVAQINADAWAIGARGFQWQYANKLLVMIDGRSIYSPLAGGVRWEDNPVFLEDLDRVEVVRGPGSSVWGANAVNGVINIVTRSAFETLGSSFAAATGTHQGGVIAARQGFRLSKEAAVRFFGEYQARGDGVMPSGLSAEDAFRMTFGGMRLDWGLNPDDTITVQAGLHDRRSDYVRTFASLDHPPAYTAVSTTPQTGRGSYFTGHWSHQGADGSTLAVYSSFDHNTRTDPRYDEDVDTVEIGAVYTAHPSVRQLFTAGVGYRRVYSHFAAGYFDALSADEHPELFSGFFQDEISLPPERLKLSLGAKLEHHESTGWNLQPSVRLTWQPQSGLTVWASAGQAVRTPTLAEQTLAIDALVYPAGTVHPALPAVVRILGNPDIKSEKMTAWEAGVRWQATPTWSVDWAGFAYQYRDYVLVTGDSVTLQAQPPALVLGQRYQNGITGESYGGELAVQWEPRSWWRLGAHANFVQIQLHTSMSDPLAFEQDEATTPHFSGLLTSDWQLGRSWQVHCAARYVDSVRYYGIPAYTELDARIAWQVNQHLEVALTGRNLLDAQHPEYDSAISRRLTEIPRNLSLQCQWRY